jgi:hypothetical protein
MSSSRSGLRAGRRLIAALALAFALVCGLMPAPAAGQASSAEDRRRFVAVARQLEEAPLAPRLAADRQWAFNWLVEAPDVSVTVCANSLGGLLNEHYARGPEILVQYSLSMAAAVIERPDLAGDPIAQQLAGTEGALRAYRAVLRDRPEDHSPSLDALVLTQSRGQLRDFVSSAWPACSHQE